MQKSPLKWKITISICVCLSLLIAGSSMLSRMQSDRFESLSAEVHTAWSRGFARACDLHQRDMGSYAVKREYDVADYLPLFNPDLLPAAVKEKKRAVIVHVTSDNFVRWMREVWPVVKVPLVLVTGEADESFPCDPFRGKLSEIELADFLKDDRLVHWFAQNIDIGARDGHGKEIGFACNSNPPPSISAKVSPLPIGVDFHTLAELVGPGFVFYFAGYSYTSELLFGKTTAKWGSPHVTAATQQGIMDTLVSQLPKNADRPPEALVNWFSNSGDTYDTKPSSAGRSGQINMRATHRGLLPPGSHWAFRDGLARAEAWRVHGSYSFVVSPPGNGIDTHRTWEALALHCIPIVLRDSLVQAQLFEGLPVVAVDSFAEVTKSNLLEWHKDLSGMFEKPEVLVRIEQKWWFDQILNKAMSKAAGLGAP